MSNPMTDEQLAEIEALATAIEGFDPYADNEERHPDNEEKGCNE
jgi:hypothetical protein